MGSRAVRRWKLSPVRREEPRCADYQDEQTVRDFEREVRVHRAYAEAFVVTALDEQVDGAYRVEGDARHPHTVDLVDGSGERDACGCPDFLGNELGTCKHLEAVRRAIVGDRNRLHDFARLGRAPRVPTLYIAGRGPLRLALAGPRAASFGRSIGLRLGEGGEVLGLTSGALGENGNGRVVHAAARALEILSASTALDDRRKEMLAARAAGRVHLEVLREPLFAYQEAGVMHLASSGRALLADDMGLGKTVQAIAACEVLRARGEARRVLVVTPASLKDQWARGIARYTGARAAVVAGNVERRHATIRSDAAYTITNYELTWRDLSVLTQFPPDVLILDEAQRAKNFRTKTAATLRALPSRFLFVLTGTPIENRLDDLYSLLQLVDPRALGPLWRFNHEFHEQDARGKVTGYKALGALRARIAPLVLRRRKEEVLTQLPPLTQQTRYIPLSP